MELLEKEMATHSSVLAWRVPGTGEPVGFCLWGLTESDTHGRELHGTYDREVESEK